VTDVDVTGDEIELKSPYTVEWCEDVAEFVLFGCTVELFDAKHGDGRCHGGPGSACARCCPGILAATTPALLLP
jgi:hypothetical protein